MYAHKRPLKTTTTTAAAHNVKSIERFHRQRTNQWLVARFIASQHIGGTMGIIYSLRDKKKKRNRLDAKHVNRNDWTKEREKSRKNGAAFYYNVEVVEIGLMRANSVLYFASFGDGFVSSAVCCCRLSSRNSYRLKSIKRRHKKRARAKPKWK